MARSTVLAHGNMAYLSLSDAISYFSTDGGLHGGECLVNCVAVVADWKRDGPRTSKGTGECAY